MAAMLVGRCDAVARRWRVRQRLREAEERANAPPEVVAPDVPQIGTQEDPTLRMHTRFTDAIEWVNVRAGEFVAYWAVISVFGYYYEVIARFAFNSPTNWVHESMFLMYGMQYMLAGAYAYHERPACPRRRVLHEVLAARQSDRRHHHLGLLLHLHAARCSGPAGASPARFDPGNVGEVSFTEWGVQYWPVKLMMPIGAALLLLQGISKLIKDIIILTRGRA